MFGPSRKPGRLAQWSERHSSSSGVGALLAWMGRPVLVRLAMVLTTAALVALLVYCWGPPMPYRVGEVYPSDLRVRVYFEVVNQPQTDWRREEAVESLPAAETGDPVAREEASKAIRPVVDPYPVGMPLVRRGQPITERQLNLLQEEHRAYLRSLSPADQFNRTLALFLVISLLAAVVVLYSARFQ